MIPEKFTDWHECVHYNGAALYCTALTTMVCADGRRCKFFKTPEQARADKLASIRSRKERGIAITPEEQEVLDCADW